MSDTEQNPVTRDEFAMLIVKYLESLDGCDAPYVDADDLDDIGVDGSFSVRELADAILAEFTLTRKFESAEVDPWVDPEPWVYVVTGKRAVHPLPQMYYRYAPRTHLDYDVAQRTAGK